MKKKRTLLVALLTLVCVVCAAFGLTACSETVIKVGETNIGTVTAEGSTYGVSGDKNTVYMVTVQVNGEVCDGVTISLNDEELGTGFSTFTYAEDCKLTFKAVSEAVENVTVVMEKFVPGPTSYTLTADNAITANIKAGTIVTLTVATQDGKTYTIDVSDDNVLFVGRLGNYSGPDTFHGSEYVDFGNVATIQLIAEKDVKDVKITMTVKDTEDGGEVIGNYPALTVGANSVNGAGAWTVAIYSLEITEAGNYSFTGVDDDCVVVGTTVTTGFGGSDIGGIQDADEVTHYYNLSAGKYYVGVYAEGTVTLTVAKN